MTQDKVLFHVEGRKRVAERRIEWIDLFTDVGRLVQRLAVGVCRREFEPPSTVARAQFKGVVVGMPNGGLKGIATKVWPQWTTRSVDLAACNGIVDRVFSVCAAGQSSGLHFARLTETQAEGRIAGIRFNQNSLTMARCTNI